jgi:hypothetical protein
MLLSGLDANKTRYPDNQQVERFDLLATEEYFSPERVG